MHQDRILQWPPHRVETLPWQQQVRGGTREDRMMRSVDATIPFIRELDYMPPLEVMLHIEHALLAVAQADTDAEGHSAALSRFMVRSESAASSKIELINASARDYAKALAGSKGNTSATSMVAASAALHDLITRVGESGRFELDYLKSAHRALMADDPQEADDAGRLRDMQNWIGGSDHSPRGALHVPPAPLRVPELMDDLIAYLNRDDVPVMTQAAIGHAQFESVHLFTDGNGRSGRALVSAVLRRRGVTRKRGGAPGQRPARPPRRLLRRPRLIPTRRPCTGHRSVRALSARGSRMLPRDHRPAEGDAGAVGRRA